MVIVFNCRAVNVIIDKNKSIVDDKMAEGITALHIAVVNGFIEISSALINRVSVNCESYLLYKLAYKSLRL
jgi:ankyrin repeat protein